MALPFCQCDDVHDAAAQVIEALNSRLSRRELRLAAPDALREVIAGALQLAMVEDAEGPDGICPGCSARVLPDPLDLLCPVCTAEEETAEARPLEEVF